MTIIDFQPVKRCPKCGRLIPQHLDTCPYCQGDYSFRRPEAAPESVITPRQPMDPKTKKRILLGIAGAAIIGLIIWGVIFIMGAMRLNKSILKPFTPDEVTAICKDHPNFDKQYAIIEQMRNFINEAGIQEEYGDITYKDAIAFIDRVNDEKWTQETMEKAISEYEEKFHKPILPKVKAEEEKWKKYIEEHDPNKYLVVTPSQKYIEDGWYYYPGFNYELEFPRGPISDCNVHCGLVNIYSDEWHGSCQSYSDLDDLRMHHPGYDSYWTGEYSFYQDIFETWTMKAEVLSVTLNDGTVISVDDVENNVPQTAREYINNPNSDDSPFIRECIDTNYPLKVDYVNNYYTGILRKDFPLIYKLFETEMPKRGFFIDLTINSNSHSSFEVPTDYDADSAVCETAAWADDNIW